MLVTLPVARWMDTLLNRLMLFPHLCHIKGTKLLIVADNLVNIGEGPSNYSKCRAETYWHNTEEKKETTKLTN